MIFNRNFTREWNYWEQSKKSTNLTWLSVYQMDCMDLYIAHTSMKRSLRNCTKRWMLVKVMMMRWSINFYIITLVILAFWLVLAYVLLEDRRTDDDSARFKFFWNLNLHQSQFFAKHSNQSVRFIFYGHHVSAIFVSVKVAKFEIKGQFFYVF